MFDPVSAVLDADFRTAPYWHQLREFEQSCELRSRALIWQMRTGKTKVVIDTACHLYTRGLIDAVLVMAPNGVHENWTERELPIHHWASVPYVSAYWDTDVAGEKADQSGREEWLDRFKGLLRRPELAWFSIASETMIRKEVRSMVRRIINMRKGGVLAVFDESHDFRGPGSKRTAMARAIARKCAFRRILSGTPVENSPLHAWSQYELLEEGALGFDKYKDFKDHHAVYKIETNRKGQKYPVLDEYRNLDQLRDRMASWSSTVLRSDCEDLPDLIPVTRPIELTEEQRRVYRELHSAFELELGGQVVSVGENTAKMVKLQQVVSGFLKDEFGDVHDIPGGNPRLDALSEEVRRTPGKAIVWCAFHEDMDRAAARLRADGWEVVEYHGRVGAEGKRRARAALAPGAENDVKALVGYPTPGLDLSAAGKIVWYSHTFDAIKRTQADDRATAMGGDNIPVVDFTAGGIDGYILSNVKSKVSVADALTREGMRAALRQTRI